MELRYDSDQSLFVGALEFHVGGFTTRGDGLPSFLRAVPYALPLPLLLSLPVIPARALVFT